MLPPSFRISGKSTPISDVSTKLFKRSCVVTVGTTRIANIGTNVTSSDASGVQPTGLDVWFEVRRSLKVGEPNTCDLRLFNLSDSTRKAVEAGTGQRVTKGGEIVDQFVPAGEATDASIEEFASATVITPVQIEAGYEGATSTIFLGELRSAQTVTDGPDRVTELMTGDGDRAIIIARSNFSVGAGANAYQVVLQLLKDMKVGKGNIVSVEKTLRTSRLYSKGACIKGSSFDILNDLAASCGLEVSMQGGVAQFLPIGQPLDGEAYLLSSRPVSSGRRVSIRGSSRWRRSCSPASARAHPSKSTRCTCKGSTESCRSKPSATRPATSGDTQSKPSELASCRKGEPVDRQITLTHCLDA